MKVTLRKILIAKNNVRWELDDRKNQATEKRNKQSLKTADNWWKNPSYQYTKQWQKIKTKIKYQRQFSN